MKATGWKGKVLGVRGRSRESSGVFRQKLSSKGQSNHRPKLDMLVRPDTMVVVPVTVPLEARGVTVTPQPSLIVWRVPIPNTFSCSAFQ